MIKNLYRNLFSSLPFGARVLLLLYALGYPLALLASAEERLTRGLTSIR